MLRNNRSRCGASDKRVTLAVVGGLSALGGALAGLGIPKNSVIQYETALKADKFLVLAHGTLDEVTRAKSLIDGTKPAEAAIHHA